MSDNYDPRIHYRTMRQTCKEIAAEFADSGIYDDCAYAHQQADGLHDVIYTCAAWRTVQACRECSGELYDRAHESLTYTEGDKIGKDETIDNVITRLAYWIHVALIIEEIERLREEEESNE